MSDAAGLVLLVGRVLFSVFLLVSAFGHVTQGQMIVGYARAKAFPLATFAGWPAGVYLGVAALSLLLGIWPDIGAIMLGLFVIPAALYFHNFWTVKDAAAKRTEQGNFLRNVALLGAALALFALFASVGTGLKFVITAPLIRF